MEELYWRVILLDGSEATITSLNPLSVKVGENSRTISEEEIVEHLYCTHQNIVSKADGKMIFTDPWNLSRDSSKSVLTSAFSGEWEAAPVETDWITYIEYKLIFTPVWEKKLDPPKMELSFDSYKDREKFIEETYSSYPIRRSDIKQPVYLKTRSKITKVVIGLSIIIGALLWKRMRKN